MPWQAWLVTAVLVVDFAIKVVALGVVPRNRRPGSSQAWLLLILLVPLVGLPLFLLIGSPYLHGRRNQIQAAANRVLLERGGHRPMLPHGLELPDGIDGAIALNRTLAALPCVTGTPIGLYPGYEDSIAAMTEAVRGARRDVWFEIYILALDDTTEPFFDAMAEAVRRGVVVRLMYDHWGSRKYPGFEAMNRRLTADGVHLAPDAPDQTAAGQVAASRPAQPPQDPRRRRRGRVHGVAEHDRRELPGAVEHRASGGAGRISTSACADRSCTSSRSCSRSTGSPRPVNGSELGDPASLPDG